MRNDSIGTYSESVPIPDRETFSGVVEQCNVVVAGIKCISREIIDFPCDRRRVSEHASVYLLGLQPGAEGISPPLSLVYILKL